MIQTIYVEESVRNHPRTREICARFPGATQIDCERYNSVFNSNSQNFRLQKQQPSLILAHKRKGYVLPTPPDYGIGGSHNYYFSHMLNCVYDCRYCFLQGMYRSANYVVFVNYEDYFDQIESTAKEASGDSWFFSGYDCDSLAFEPVTGFMRYALDRFSLIPKAHLEIRTKSTQVRDLLSRPPIKNCVIAFSFTPEKVSQSLEHRVPSIKKRVLAMQKLQNHGWKIGLRFDPIVHSKTLESDYRDLFTTIFESIDPKTVHSASYGTFRLPKPFFKKMVTLYPEEKLFALPLTEHKSQVSFGDITEELCLSTVHNLLIEFIDERIIFPCS